MLCDAMLYFTLLCFALLCIRASSCARRGGTYEMVSSRASCHMPRIFPAARRALVLVGLGRSKGHGQWLAPFSFPSLSFAVPRLCSALLCCCCVGPALSQTRFKGRHTPAVPQPPHFPLTQTDAHATDLSPLLPPTRLVQSEARKGTSRFLHPMPRPAGLLRLCQTS